MCALPVPGNLAVAPMPEAAPVAAVPLPPRPPREAVPSALRRCPAGGRLNVYPRQIGLFGEEVYGIGGISAGTVLPMGRMGSGVPQGRRGERWAHAERCAGVYS
ncbi:hypothetical protein GCM10010319_31720 [Streptomyces blastmyceticus]|uniref:Uncharacterized protein n=1 Tax=Streptomyces blastmyceticus TaxID=68180 RepID=A0ABN0X0R8_9ACTN